MYGKAFLALWFLGISALVASAADYTWQGVNRDDADTVPHGTVKDVDNAAVWLDDTGGSAVPDTGDTAIFNWNHGNNSYDNTTYESDVHVDATTPGFAPDALRFYACGDNGDGYLSDKDLYLDKSMTLRFIELRGSISNQYGSRGTDRLRLGTQVTGLTFTVGDTTNSRPIDFTTHADTAYWNMITLGETATLSLAGTTIRFDTVPDHENRAGELGGGTVNENAANTANGWLRFDHPTAGVFLAGQGLVSGTLNAGYANVGVYSTQTWTADDSAYVWLRPRDNAGGAGPLLITPLDGQPLDNLARVNLLLSQPSTTDISKAGASRLAEGVYGGVHMRQAGTDNHRDNRVALAGDVTLVGRAVDIPDRDADTAAIATDYSLILDGWGTQNTSLTWLSAEFDDQFFHTAGHNLTLAYGLCFRDTNDMPGCPDLVLDAAGSTVRIAGNVRAYSLNDGPDGAEVNDRIGIEGDADTVVQLLGDWDVRTAARTGNNLSLSTMQLLGESQTVELGDAADATAGGADTFSLDRLEIGDGDGTTVVQLVNNYLNDNPYTGETTDKDGEKLIVAALDIKAGATLDLNTGLSLSHGDIVRTLLGEGDLTANWSAFAGRIVDGTNPGQSFQPTYDAGDDATYWQVIPEPTTLCLLALGAAVLGRRRV